MKEEYEKDKYNWFPNETTKELKAYNKRKANTHARVSRRIRTK